MKDAAMAGEHTYHMAEVLAQQTHVQQVADPPLHLGISLRSVYTTWDALRTYGLLVEALGYDSLWTSDHFIGSEEDLDAPIFEGWQLLAAWGALTSRLRIGLLVSGNTYRHPAILAKMAITLDHITHGRAVLGLGAGWYQREHLAYGIPVAATQIRLAKLAEAAELVRTLLDQPRTSFEGMYYHLVDAPSMPRPIQQHLPLLIGGGGERKTLRIVARFADLWNGFGSVEVIAHKLVALRGHCAELGRDVREILPTVAFGVIIRDDPAALRARLHEIETVNHGDSVWLGPSGTVEAVAQGLAEYWRVGVRGFIVDMPAPYDDETLRRLVGEVQPRVYDLIGR
jgi:alkanesulfonate monooxygenase SsuD/methylene tetrahydromethanopterin reductase-like flavin-dependent oxidoreductase (luciferase family)